MKHFTSKVLWFFVPFLLFPLSYIVLDPFKVLYNYENYSLLTNEGIPLNRDFISTESFLHNHKKQSYDSFIFGSSRTLAFRPSSWQLYLKENAKSFSFDASGESIFGIYKKFKLLDSLNIEINNALIIICRDQTFKTTKNYQGHLLIKHPIISKESHTYFEITFFKAYIDPQFFSRYIIYKLTRRNFNFYNGYIDNRIIFIDTITNELKLSSLESELSLNEKIYYENRKNLFFTRNGERTDTIDQIKTNEKFMLNEIAKILRKNKTNYKIIISPLYEQITYSEKDLHELMTIFDKNVFDFSGNNIYTYKIENFYETSHFRPHVGDSILKIIYSRN